MLGTVEGAGLKTEKMRLLGSWDQSIVYKYGGQTVV